ncbi:MAG: GNAT family N-acetyltransferase [Defluviitaleaceae bacterium]|nr:GNAT family N-acetyltransferase [Defluviitaleaceae bacterium]
MTYKATDIQINQSNNPKYEALLDDFIQEVFGFSFAPWFEQKLWDERYISYSIIEEGKMLSNVCIYKTEMLVQGQRAQALSFGAVGTRKCAKGKGLSRLLMEHVLSLHPNTPAYLFANESVLDFYPRFGFRPVQTYKPVITAKINNDPAKAIKLDEDDEIVTKAISERAVFSNLVDCLNTAPIQMFHMLLEYAEDIYYLPAHDAVVIAQQEGSELFIADVMAKKPIDFETLKAALPFESVDTIEFGFSPDWLGVTPIWEPADMADEPFFVRGEWNLPDKFCYPAMSET